VVEFRNPENPWPDKPEIPPLVIEDPFDSEPESDEETGLFRLRDYGFEDRFKPPSDEDIGEQNARMLHRQCLDRWAAQAIAVSMSEAPEVQKVAALGSAAKPLATEIPRFHQFRRNRIEVFHECRDLDLAVWMTDLGQLQFLKKRLHRGLSIVQDTLYGGVAPHQVDTHIFDDATGAYRGRLCIFGQCPKPRKHQCQVPGCGDELFLQQFAKYRFNPAQFDAEPLVILFDRASGFLVRMPRMEVKPTFWKSRSEREDDVLTRYFGLPSFSRVHFQHPL